MTACTVYGAQPQGLEDDELCGRKRGEHRHYTKVERPGSIFDGAKAVPNTNLQFSGVRFGVISSARSMPVLFLAHRPPALAGAFRHRSRVSRRRGPDTPQPLRIDDQSSPHSRLIQRIATGHSKLFLCHSTLPLRECRSSRIWHVCLVWIWHSVLRTLRVAARFTSIISGSERAPVAEFARFQAQGYCLSIAFSLCSIHTLVPSRSPSKSRNHKSRVP